ncbi:hypothetical protein MMC25_004971 [Agyrium rufum]|nr:hypothetical protein [Agyrium rufum]
MREKKHPLLPQTRHFSPSKRSPPLSSPSYIRRVARQAPLLRIVLLSLVVLGLFRYQSLSSTSGFESLIPGRVSTSHTGTDQIASPVASVVLEDTITLGDRKEEQALLKQGDGNILPTKVEAAEEEEEKKTLLPSTPCDSLQSPSSLSTISPSSSPISTIDKTKAKKRIPLEAHVMSKCPDARDCLRDLVLPAMEKIVEKVDFELSFIGALEPDDETVTCKHGATECLGNIFLLCAERLYPSGSEAFNPSSPSSMGIPEEDPSGRSSHALNLTKSLGFANCLISSYKEIPSRELTEECALEHGVDFAALNACSSDEGEQGGYELLRNSVIRSRDARVEKSCTVRLQGEQWCVRDGGKWYGGQEGVEECQSVDALVERVEGLYGREEL